MAPNEQPETEPLSRAIAVKACAVLLAEGGARAVDIQAFMATIGEGAAFGYMRCHRLVDRAQRLIPTDQVATVRANCVTISMKAVIAASPGGVAALKALGGVPCQQRKSSRSTSKTSRRSSRRRCILTAATSSSSAARTATANPAF